VVTSDQEAPRVDANSLVLVGPKLDHAATAQPTAFAAEGRRLVLSRPVSALERLVDVPERGLITGDPSFQLVFHERILAVKGEVVVSRE
jgi:hypothetical protein